MICISVCISNGDMERCAVRLQQVTRPCCGKKKIGDISFVQVLIWNDVLYVCSRSQYHAAALWG